MWKMTRNNTEINSTVTSDVINRKELEEILCDVLTPLRKRADSSEEEIFALRRKIDILEEEKNGMNLEIKNLKNEANNLFSFAFVTQCLAFGLLSYKINLIGNERPQQMDEKAKTNLKEEIEETLVEIEDAKTKEGMEEDYFKDVEEIRVADEHEECHPIANGDADNAFVDPAWIASWKILPYNGGTNVLEWANKFKDYISLLNGINEANKLNILRFYLEGMARDVLYKSMPTTLEEAINILINYFQNYAAKEMARKGLNVCKQKSGETVFSFANRLLTCLNNYMNEKNGEIFESQLLERFMDGLNKKLYSEVAKKMPKTYEEAYDMAQLIELLDGKYKSTKIATNSVNAPQRGRKIRVCYFCRKPGHIINKCPERREAENRVNCPINNYRMEERRTNRYEILKGRERYYPKEDYRYNDSSWRERESRGKLSRCKYNAEINNWRSPSYKDEPENWRNISSLSEDGHMFKDANWRDMPTRTLNLNQSAQTFNDANWREMPVPESDQLGRTFKDVRCDGLY